MGRAPEQRPTDDLLLFHTMMCMAAADGVMQDAEIATVEAFSLSLPELRGRDFTELLEASKALIDEHGGVTESVEALRAIESEAVRKKAFVLAVDVALASGEVHQAEDQMLDAMQRILDIGDGLASQVIEVLSLKYAR